MSRAWTRLQAAEDIECLGAWCGRSRPNVARDRLRRRATEARALETMLRPTTAEPAAVEMVDVDFERALDRLPARQREIATLRYVEDLSCDEIAAQLGTSSGYVRSAMFRSRRAIVAAVLAVVAIIVATVMVRSDAQHDPVRVDITPATQPTPTTNAPSQPSADDDDAAGPVVVGDATTDDVTGDAAAGRSQPATPRGQGPATPTTGVAPIVVTPATSGPAPGNDSSSSPPVGETPATTTPTTAAPATGEPTADTVTVTCCGWGLGTPYRDVVVGGRASMWTIAPAGDITLRLYSPPNESATYTLHIAAATVSPAPPPNIAGGWTFTIAPGEVVILQVRNLTAVQMDNCWVQGCRLEFFPE